MAAIKHLPESVSSKIAAGEVIERPASLLKELLENSLDAGATKIAVEVTGAGRKTLRVTDDGSGMTPKDCALALERHATSKISSLTDLADLSSFGFRGEALFAAAAVSRLTLTSRPPKASAGHRIVASAGKITSSGPAACSPGTTIEIKDLFYNTPARAKFLKSDTFEKSRLSSVLEEAALAHPGVSFSYKSESRTTLRFSAEKKPGSTDAFRRRTAGVLGRDLAAPLVAVEADRPEGRLRMFISPWDGLTPSRNLQYWFVNGRPIVSRVLQQALYRAYKDYRTRDRHPVCVAFLEMDPGAFDVNVHPGKREVRFRSDRAIHELVAGLVFSTLSRAKPAPPLVPSYGGQVREPSRSYGAPSFGAGGGPLSSPALALETRPAEAFTAEGTPAWFTPPFRYLGQVEKSYLVFEASGGLFVLDQHAAAERILFERYIDDIAKHQGGQKLLVPLAVELPASRVQHVLSLAGQLKDLGFEMESFGKTTVRFTAVPSMFKKSSELKELVHRLLDSFNSPVAAAQDVKHHAVSTIACKAAVKAHDPLSAEEAMRLIEDLKDCRDGSSCPHGRRAILSLNREELARRFQRPGAPPL